MNSVFLDRVDPIKHTAFVWCEALFGFMPACSDVQSNGDILHSNGGIRHMKFNGAYITAMGEFVAVSGTYVTILGHVTLHEYGQ